MPSPETLPPLPYAFHVMAKPTGPICNLDCHYCFYLEKEKLYGDKKQWAMADSVLERHISSFIASQQAPEITFAWQGGEPTLLGVDFFRRAVALQQEHAGGRRVLNTFQTNGVLINDAWAEFLKENEFLVGLSIDGPEPLHNAYRRDKGGHPTFNKVMKGLECLKRHGVEFNTLTCVHAGNVEKPLDVYRFLREQGSGFIQFIPIVERLLPEPGADGLTLVRPDDMPEAQVAPWCARPEQYGRFLVSVFEEWVRRDVGKVFVQLFDVALEAWVGMQPSLCLFRETCGSAMALEHNGDLYSCDHYVYPENKLGNIMETPLAEMVQSEQQRQFGNAKRDTLPKYCRECPVHFVCRGECPKHRFLRTPDGEPGLNYLCAGYKRFFTHIDPHMRFMAGELRQQRPPANVMDWVRERDRMLASGKPAPQPGQTVFGNDPCPCCSGKKFKKCCGVKK